MSLTIGSANTFDRSFEFDTELNAFVENAKAAKAARLRLWGEHLGLPAKDLKNPHTALRKLIRSVEKNDRTTEGPLSGRLTTLDVQPLRR